MLLKVLPFRRRRPESAASQAAAQADGNVRRSLLIDWLVPIGVIAGFSTAAFLGLRLWDFERDASGNSLFQVLFLTDPADVGNALGNFTELMVGVMGLVFTVVAIVLQLAAQRYTPRLVDMFIADRVNVTFFALMSGGTLYTVLISYTMSEDFVPFWSALAVVFVSTVILSTMAPYFKYVFRFLTPDNIIHVIRANALRAMETVRDKRAAVPQFRRHQDNVATSMEQISDIALSAVSQMDRGVALLALRTLKDLMVDHLLIKRRMPKEWFVPRKDHFTSISSDFLKEIYISRNWVEVKGFLDMDLIFKMAIKEMPDAVSAIANNTKIVGLYAMKLKDPLVLADSIQFFNTFLRHAINARNPKAIYNVFYQYRLLAEEVMQEDPKLTEKIAFYFKYYGQTAQQYNIPLILITACFDLVHITQRAYDLKLSNVSALVKTLLEVDDNPATRSNEFDLRSVRKAQLMFAAFLLSREDEMFLERIQADIQGESPERLQAIRREMLAVQDRKFWEVTDRGVDFFYMDEEQKRYLNEFFDRYIQLPPEEPQLQSA